MASFNKVILIGNLVRDPILKTTQSGMSVVSFTVAVGRKFAKDTDKSKADFINVVAWRKTAEFVAKYFGKGKAILVEGQLQTSQYTAQDGSKRTTVEVVAFSVDFAGSGDGGSAKVTNENGGESGMKIAGGFPGEDGFEEVAPEDDLPF